MAGGNGNEPCLVEKVHYYLKRVYESFGIDCRWTTNDCRSTLSSTLDFHCVSLLWLVTCVYRTTGTNKSAVLAGRAVLSRPRHTPRPASRANTAFSCSLTYTQTGVSEATTAFHNLYRNSTARTETRGHRTFTVRSHSGTYPRSSQHGYYSQIFLQ